MVWIETNNQQGLDRLGYFGSCEEERIEPLMAPAYKQAKDDYKQAKDDYKQAQDDYQQAQDDYRLQAQIEFLQVLHQQLVNRFGRLYNRVW